MARLLPFLALALLPPVLAAGDFEAQSGGLLTVYDRSGNALSVSNRFDGHAHFVQMTQFGRYGGVAWDRTHQDGYEERATAVTLDPAGSAYLAGVRRWEGRKYLWALKLSPQGQVLWERADTEAGCSAFSVVASESGDSWVAGSCLGGPWSPVRVMRLSPAGSILWTQSFEEGGRKFVRGLTLDHAGRVAVTMEIAAGDYGTGAVRTAVYDRNGSRVTVY